MPIVTEKAIFRWQRGRLEPNQALHFYRIHRAAACKFSWKGRIKAEFDQGLLYYHLYSYFRTGSQARIVMLDLSTK